MESRVAATAGLGTALTARRPALEQKNAALLRPGHSDGAYGRCPGLPPRCPTNCSLELPRHFLAEAAKENCARRVETEVEWAGPVTGVTGRSTYQKPGPSCKYSSFAEASAANQLPESGGVERVWGGGKLSGGSIGCRTAGRSQGLVTGVEGRRMLA